MRIAIANMTSTLVHVAVLGGMALWSLDAWQPQFQVAAGHAITVQYAPASASSEAERTIEIPPTDEEPVETKDIKHEPQRVNVDRHHSTAETKAEPARADEAVDPRLAELQLPTTKVLAESLPEEAIEASEEATEEKPAAAPPEQSIAAVPIEFQSADIAGAVDQKPSPIVNPGPSYPVDAVQAGIFERFTVVRVRVAVDGTVLSAIVETSSGWPSIDAEALRTIRRWRFNPARRGGQAVEFDYRHLFEFGLRRS